MKKKWALYLLLIINLFFFSCFNSDKKEKITKLKFTEIFKELEYLKVRYEMGFLNDSIYNFEYNQIFSKNELTEEVFKNKMEEYLENLSEFESILKEIQLELDSISKDI